MNSRRVARSPFRRSPAACLLAAMTALACPAYVFGADIFKANNADSLESANSWVGGVLPTDADIAVFDSSFVPPSGNFIGLNSSLSLQGIKVVGAAPAIIVDSLFAPSTPTLTLGSAGLDFSAAASGSVFDFDNPTINLATSQVWSIADGATVSIKGSITRAPGALLSVNYGPLATGVITASNFTANSLLAFGTANNITDFLGVDASFRIQPAASIAGLYSPNVPGGMSGSHRGVDVVNVGTGTANNAFRLSNTMTVTGGIRFATPHSTPGTTWAVNMEQGRSITISNASILVTSALGNSAVTFNRPSGTAGSLRLSAGSSLTVIQNNTAANLVFNAPVTQAAGTASTLAKAGAGVLVLAGDNAFNGALTINQGGVQIGNAGATGSIPASSNVVNQGSLRFNRTGNVTFTNVISGSGSVSQLGSGEVVLSGNNTFTGPLGLSNGILTFSSPANLGNGTEVNFTGGALRWATGNTLDLSGLRTLSFGAGGGGIDTNGQDIVFASPVGAAGAGGIRKLGAGSLTLQAGSGFQGENTVSAGTLLLANASGSATGSGNITVSAGAVLAGTGTAAGVATLGNNAVVAPGSGGVGTLTLGGLTLNTGSVLNLEFGASSNDQVATTVSNGLTINGGGVNLLAEGGTSALSAPGTYNLLQYSGTVQGSGASALSVLNAQPGYAYTFGTSGGFVTLQVELDAILSQWSTSGSGSWNTAGSWSNGVPTGGYTAQFTTQLAAPATITLDGSRTANGLVFNSANGYTIAPGTGGSLTLDKGLKNVAVNVDQGNHTISAPLVLSSTIATAVAPASELSISGSVSGPGGLIKSGAGVLNLDGANTFAGDVTVTTGTLGFAQASGLGTGSLTLDGGAIRYNSTNTADISSRSITFGVNGATVDTNGNNVAWAGQVGNGGAGGLTKSGAGVLTLGAANNYNGPTTLRSGGIQISANDRLGLASANLTFDGGTLLTNGDFTLATVVDSVSVVRPIQVNAGGGAINVAANSTLTINSALGGTGVLAKEGNGTLVLTSTGSSASKSGGFTHRSGTIRFGSNLDFGVGTSGFLGTGTLRLEGGTVNSANTDTSTLLINNPIDVPAGSTVSIATPNRFSLTGAMSGSGVINMSVNTNVSRADLSNNWTSFNGTLNLSGTGTVRLLTNGGSFTAAGLANTALNSTGLTFTAATNSGGNTFQIGALSGNSTLTNSVGSFSIWQIGARGDSTVFSGNFVRGNNYNTLTKVGNGTLTLTGSTLQDGFTNVNAGTLLVDSVIPASTAAVAPSRAVTVAAGATLGGSGTITPDTVVNGILRPDPTGLRGGHLTFGGVLELAATSTTQFDFNGASFTGVKSTATGTITYGGAVVFNFPGTIFNGTYKVFDLAVAPTGTFSGVTATSSVTTTPVALDGTSGSWEGTLDGASLSFNPTTGELTVTGSSAGSAVTPAASTLSAIGANASANLSWTSASGADTYTVKRATVAGGPYTNVVSNLVGTSYSDTALTNGTTYYYVVQARNSASGLSGALSNEASVTPTLVSYTSLQNWRFEQFGVYDDTAEVLAGDTEDFDGDGQANLLEYALGTDPKVPNASPVVVGRSGNFLTLTYPRRSVADSALTYTVQGGSDLATAFTAGSGSTNNVGSTYTYTDNVDVSASGVRRFLRLSVSYTTP